MQTAPAPTPWLLRAAPAHSTPHSSDVQCRLFCVPPAGMGAWVYQAWAAKLGPHVQVLPIELPGHGSRIREPRVTNLCQLSVQAVDALETHFTAAGQVPYALLGHSMGAWIVWEMLLEIERRGLPPPTRLFVSGNRAPCLHGAEHDLDPTRMHTLTSPEAFWAHFTKRYGENKHLVDPAMRALMHPILLDDFTLTETYEPSNPAAKTSVPVVAIGGALDTRYTREQVAAWSQHTHGSTLTEVWLDNQGHNYVADCPDDLMAALRRELLLAPGGS